MEVSLIIGDVVDCFQERDKPNLATLHFQEIAHATIYSYLYEAYFQSGCQSIQVDK